MKKTIEEATQLERLSPWINSRMQSPDLVGTSVNMNILLPHFKTNLLVLRVEQTSRAVSATRTLKVTSVRAGFICPLSESL